MSWLISDDVNVNSTGHLSTYDGNLYYNQDSWRLCKNMMWVGPASQKWQQSIDLDGFFSTDMDFGFDKKFNGFTVKTSTDMPSLSQSQGSLPTEAEPYKSISSTTHKKDFVGTQDFYVSNEVMAEKETVTTSSYNFEFTAKCDGSLRGTVKDDGSDNYYYVFKNGDAVSSNDADRGTYINVSYEKGDKIYFKVVRYSNRGTYDSADSDGVVSSGSSISLTYDDVRTYNRKSFYGDACIAENTWKGWLTNRQNCDSYYAARPFITKDDDSTCRADLIYNLNDSSVYPAIVSVYVGGELCATKTINSKPDDYSGSIHFEYTPKYPDYESSHQVVLVLRPYWGIPAQSVMEDDIISFMKYSTLNYEKTVGMGFSGIGGWKNGYNYERSSVIGDVQTVSVTQTRSRDGYNLTDATSAKTVLPKINGLPYKGTTLKTPSYTSSTDFISPNQHHRKSGHFVVIKDGTVSVKCALQSLTAYINSYDNYTNINPSITITKNGIAVVSYSNYNETKSYATDISVSTGDLISVSVSGTFTQNSYYELDYDDEVVDKCYLTGDKDETGFTVYKSNYDSVNTPAYDMAFVVSKAGTLNWSYNDVRENATSSSSDGILNIFVNGERKVRADNDGTSSSGSISLSIGDVVLVRYSTYSTISGDKDSYVAIERGWDTPGGQCTISFSGETVSAAYNHTLSWREYCKLFLAEARLWVDDNSLTDYAFPIAIIDDADNNERVSQFFEELSKSKLYVDLWAQVDNINVFDASYVKCFNADMEGSDIPTSKFEGKAITQVRIKDATSGIKAFKNADKIDKLELLDISGDWTEAFRNGVSTSVAIGKFTTNELTSAKDMFRGCEIYGIYNLDETKLKTFFNDTYDKWVAGEYNFRSAFIGSRYSGTIPEKFMSAEDQFACNWDPAILIQKIVSTYDVSRLPLSTYYGNTQQAITNAAGKYLGYSKTVHTIKLVSRQYDESYDAAYIYIDGKAVKSWGSRGHFVGVIDCKTMQFKYEGSGDTYGTPAAADAVWAAAINAADSNDIIVSVTYNATSVTSSARNSINSCGGSGSTWTSARIAHTFIGKKGLGSGNGYEGTASGSNYSTISAQFDEDRGLVFKNGGWHYSQYFGLSPVYEKQNGQDVHFDSHPSIVVLEENFWMWSPIFGQIKDCYSNALFAITENNKANFNIDVYTSGDERQINYNYEWSFRKAVESYAFDNLILHLRKVENTTNKSISIEGMVKNIENLHCVGEIKNIQDITSAFEECSSIIEVRTNLNNVEIADYAFKNCHSLVNAHIISNSCYTAMHMFENCDSITDFNIKEMTALIDATSMFEGCTAIKTEYFTKATEIPETLQVTRRMFAKCSISEISGNWVPPNSYTSYRNQDENGLGNLEDDWTNETTKEGWSFPRDLYDADQMFTENPITKISNLKFNPNANNSWIFSGCQNLTTMKYSFLDIDTFTSEKYTGMFDRCSLKKENVIWLPISISSKFELSQLGFFTNGSAGNEKITYWIVDDHWCEVDHSGFVEYQHIRRPAYLDVYRKNYDKDVIIKFWSHPHIHSAEMRGYNELHDTKVYYDPETLQGGATINYNEWLKGKQTK